MELSFSSFDERYDYLEKTYGDLLSYVFSFLNLKADPLISVTIVDNDTIQEINKIQMAVKQASLKIQSLDLDLKGGESTDINPFLEALANDLNTSNAITEVFNVIKDLNMTLRNREIDAKRLLNLFKTLQDMFSILGLEIPFVTLNDEDKKLYNQYLSYKAHKDFENSDKLRVKLIEKGIL